MPSAAILTGGQARRFGGRDKSALVVNGRTILERQLAELSQLTDDILLVGSETAASRARAWPHGSSAVHVVCDRVPGCGPLGGLDTALASARDDVVILVASDMPFVTAAFFLHLANLAREADAAVPVTERGYHPLCAAYRRTCQSAVERRLAERRLAMTDLLDDVRVRPVSGRELDAFGHRDRLLANVNTPADYAKLTGPDDRHIA